MLGDPIARVAQPVGKAREVEAVMERHRAGRGGGDGRQIEDGEGNVHAGDIMSFKDLVALEDLSQDAKLMWNKRDCIVSLACIGVLDCGAVQCRHVVVASQCSCKQMIV